MRRRSFLLGACASTAAVLSPGLSLAGANTDRRLVLVLLRGGLDGLAAVPPHGDGTYREARGSAALPEAGAEGAPLPLDGTFGLHASLAAIHPLWTSRQLAFVHATSPPCVNRSHFDAQNVLENGTERPFGIDTGWLNRALFELAGAPPAMAVGRQVPLVLHGPARATSLDPLRAPRPQDPFLDRVRELYQDDPVLGPSLERALETQALLAATRGDAAAVPRRPRDADPAEAARIVAGLLSAPDGPRVAVLEMNGFDTHTGQDNSLDRQLRALGAAMAAFAEASTTWDRTVVMVVTEFGRTVAANGTNGTDHGLGGVAMLAGGAVAGGRVIADWPGLGPAALVEGRDLRPTSDLRRLFKGVLRDHLGLDEDLLATRVFPDSSAVRPFDGLIRA